jgi:hypothetical protein
MKQWNIKTSTLIILSIVFVFMLLIVILPDVDLPDTAFHRGTAPVVVHAQVTTAPAAATVATILQVPSAAEISRHYYEPGTLAFSPRPNSLSILLRSIRR